MTGPTRVLSLYEGFFAGGARILHTDVAAGLHASRGERGGQQHSVLSIASSARRESTLQSMEHDPRYLRLIREGVSVSTLGRTAGEMPLEASTFTDLELRVAAEAIGQADVILSLKEQPLGLLLALRDRGFMPDVPVAACLHRSDPTHSGPALGWLSEATATGLVTATISCAWTTSAAYERATPGVEARYVIPNGIDTTRFRPGTPREVRAARARLGAAAASAVVVFAARFDAMKDPGLFFRAVAAHARHRPDTHYLVCGAGMVRGNEALRAMLDESGVPTHANVHLLGIRDDMPLIYRTADIVALTSAFGEASPLCLIEGAASGATPVTTNVGDSAREVDGFGLVTAHDPEEIASAWEHVLTRRSAFRDAAIAARPRLGRERMLDDYRAAMDDLLVTRRIAA
ncbi:glycosyltransferase [Microbacterium sp. SLBN-146]|uniref:glycosyltransferase n=1 Tax=Microbacterium sp. SLBN-146 TaxID=2768457 RepID=UPI0011509D4C|nr:glycosyltransferase [Microbacterium sp. SLBN-146]TQJ31712.1 glycosyltransferase involved in cell wall biosynthesis [Microbacterium sp. SLBN-146]